MEKEKVLKLANLARIELGDEEASNLSRELDAILDYVGEVKKVAKTRSAKLEARSFPIRNIMREDNDIHEGGLYTKKILEQAPLTEDDYIKVKKIL